MRIKLWGVRGSLPSPVTPERVRSNIEGVLLEYERQQQAQAALSARDFLATLQPHQLGGYGGNTSCAEITTGTSRVIIDAGSGLRNFSDEIMRSEPKTTDYHIYFTHFHWDHLIGLPFFVPMYVKGKTVHFYGVHDDLEKSLETLFSKPNFPVPYSVVKQQVKIHKVEPRKPFQVGDITVTPYKLDHPDPCWGARVEHNGKSLAWAVDSECTRVSRADLGEDYKLYENADVMVFDAQYSMKEALEKINWGHASAPIGIDLAVREGVKLALFAHHDPGASDEMIFQAEQQARDYYKELLRGRRSVSLPDPALKWRFAREGEIINL